MEVFFLRVPLRCRLRRLVCNTLIALRLKNKKIYMTAPCFKTENTYDVVCCIHSLIEKHFNTPDMSVFNEPFYVYYHLLYGRYYNGEDSDINIPYCFWTKELYPVLKHCDELRVLCLDGWQQSNFVVNAIDYAKQHGIKVCFDTPCKYDITTKFSLAYKFCNMLYLSDN